MPLRTETVELEAEIERLEQEREELLDAVAEMEAGTDAYAQKVERGQEIDTFLDGLDWAVRAHEDEHVPAWGEDVDTVTFGGLTGGEYGKMEADLVEIDNHDTLSAAQAQRPVQVRAGTVQAPYLDEEADDTQQLAAVASLPVSFLKYANSRIDDLSAVGNAERKSFSESLAARSEK